MLRLVTVWLRSGLPSWRRSLYREIGDLTLRVLTRGREELGQEAACDGPDSFGAVEDDPGSLDDLSRAVCRAMVNPQRSGSVPGKDSAASTCRVP
ncbi:hypothetical protein [Kutzneria sp. 744]|uniref:hypothetical protein n=1 Tax=Kutzneria sp. (strain 744) TaxID=345341 RepID=UPI0003EECCBF|nr:hypothetical protein [Kutzneria sp. 744]EWM12095.1 hypothetical protein KUTG_02399 [Kutzneria sp. 744]